MVYQSDTSISWKHGIKSTAELASAILKDSVSAWYILTHPDYWSISPIRAGILKGAARLKKVARLNEILRMFRKSRAN